MPFCQRKNTLAVHARSSAEYPGSGAQSFRKFQTMQKVRTGPLQRDKESEQAKSLQRVRSRKSRVEEIKAQEQSFVKTQSFHSEELFDSENSRPPPFQRIQLEEKVQKLQERQSMDMLNLERRLNDKIDGLFSVLKDLGTQKKA